MAKPEKSEEKPAAPVPAPSESRIDEFAVSVFDAMGYKAPLSDSIVTVYLEFKKRKDITHPGRLSPEGFALVALLADMQDEKVSFAKKE